MGLGSLRSSWSSGPSPPSLGSPHHPHQPLQGHWADGHLGSPAPQSQPEMVVGPAQSPPPSVPRARQGCPLWLRSSCSGRQRTEPHSLGQACSLTGLQTSWPLGLLQADGDQAHLVARCVPLYRSPFPETQGLASAPAPAQPPEGTSLTTRGATWQPAGSGSVLPPRSGSGSLGGVAEVGGLENWGPSSHPHHEVGSATGSPCLGHDAATTGQMSNVAATGSAQLAGPALLVSVPSDSWARPGGPGGPAMPGFLQLLRIPRCRCAKALGPRLPPGGDQGGGPTGQRQPGSPSAWPGWLAAPPLTPVCLSPSHPPGRDAGQLGADLRLLPGLPLLRGLETGTPPQQQPPRP